MGKNKVWHYTVFISHSVTRDIHTRLNPRPTALRVVCTLPERAFVRFDASQIYSSISSEINSLASSALPYRRSPPSWLRATSEDVVEHIIELARRGLTPSQISVALRDSNFEMLIQSPFLSYNKCAVVVATLLMGLQ